MNISKKIFLLLSGSERRKAFFLIILMIIGMTLEMLGIGMVLPAITLITQGNSLDVPFKQELMSLLGYPDEIELVIVGVLLLVGVYFIKAIFLSFLVWKQTKFAFDVQATLSYRLLGRYLTQPYVFHLQRNSSELIRNVINEVNLFTFSAILPLLMLLTEMFVLVGLVFLLILLEPVGTFAVVSVVGGVSFGFYIFTRQRITFWGDQRQLHEGKRIRHIQQGLGGIRDILLGGKVGYFLEQYSISNFASAKMGEKQKTLAQLPRIWLELFAVLGLSSLVVIVLVQGNSITNVVPTVALFAAAAFRLLPSITRILASAQSIRFGLPVVTVLYDELRSLTVSDENIISNSTVTLDFESTIHIDSVCFGYEKFKKQALTNISLKINKGESVGVIGGSGAGKSTLVDVLLGLLSPDCGVIRVDGQALDNSTILQWQKKIGYVPQSIFLTDDTLRRNIAFGLSDEDIDEEVVLSCVVDAQLDVFVNSLPNGLDTVVGERGVRLSGGQIQRIGICRALYDQPEILVLDEATSALDGNTEFRVMKAINKMHGKITIIIIAHRLSTVENCDRIYQLENGIVLSEGAPSEILPN